MAITILDRKFASASIFQDVSRTIDRVGLSVVGGADTVSVGGYDLPPTAVTRLNDSAIDCHQ
jgi:hypothetical protein